MPLRTAGEFYDLLERLQNPTAPMGADQGSQAMLHELGRAIGHADARALGVRPDADDPVAVLRRARGEDDPTWSTCSARSASSDERYMLTVDVPATLESLRWGADPLPGEPVCAMTAGYLSGWCTGIVELDLTATEISCRAEGHPCCRFVVTNASVAAPESRYRAHALAARDAELAQLHTRLELERSARNDAERRLGQANKLEALGRMSGGIAHDFNNLMTVVLARGALLETRLRDDQTARAHLREMVRATERAAGLTRQLLAFSRLRPVDHEPIDIGDGLGRIGRMLESLVGDSIELEFGLPTGPLPAIIDRGELEQVVMNLVVNARDALDGAGRLWVSAAPRTVRDARTTTTGLLRPGPYAVLVVRDDGVGIEPEVLAHVFDPFFTTKSEGLGTGLGLSTVYALVIKHGGAIDITTAPGHGSCFEVYLPLAAPEQAATPDEAAEKTTSGRGETVIVVDDRPEIRAIVCDLLAADDYKPLGFDGGAAALAWAREHENEAGLLLTDVKMPQMDGPVLAEAFAPLQPSARILYMSGFSEYAVRPLLAKPFSAKELLSTVRAILDEGASAVDLPAARSSR